MPAVTENSFGKGTAYYAAFRNDADFADDFCKMLIEKANINPDCGITAEEGITIRKRGDHIFVMNFTEHEKYIVPDREYEDVINGGNITEKTAIPACGYIILR